MLDSDGSETIGQTFVDLQYFYQVTQQQRGPQIFVRKDATNIVFLTPISFNPSRTLSPSLRTIKFRAYYTQKSCFDGLGAQILYSSFLLQGSMHTGLEELGSGLLGTGKLEKMAVYFAERFVTLFISF
jgi:hypothetical protein